MCFRTGMYVNNTSKLSQVILCLYMDDLLITSAYEVEIKGFKEELMQEFEMYDLGNLLYFQGWSLKTLVNEFSCTKRIILLEKVQDEQL